ncbi:MAG: multidrug DMT transporter permease [Rhodospirillaceae bacterium]|nr:multidrug DMT transporter permease [Rhodospirillaceae bacterium]|tara:strand:+ start:68847 stop:69743 length:897 start_codon:yes stop_codon:yes gene_type:complete
MKPIDLILVLVVMTIWGGNFIAMRTGALEIPPYYLLGLRLAVASLALVWFVKSPKGMVIPLLSIGFTLCILHFGLALVGLQFIEAGTGALAMQASVPFAALLAWFVFKETFGWRRILGVIIAFIGLTVISGIPQLEGYLDMFLVMIISALCFSIASIQIRRLGTVNFMSVNAWICIFSTPMAFLISWIFESGQWDAFMRAETTTLMGILYMGLMASAVGQGIWYRLLPRYPTNQVVPFTLLVPILGIVFGIIILDETLNWELALGAATTIAGVAVIVLRGPKSVAPETAPAKEQNDSQ